MTKYAEQIKILCVDDERNVLRALERVFLDDDYEIALAGSGDEGLSIFESSGPFQIVISDYRMPVMNGVEFLKEVYKLDPDSVRIVLSGYADIGSIVAAINEGHIYKFIAKPWNDEELRETIHACLERYFLQKKNRELLTELARANRELEEKVQQRTEQLELRNQALEFSQFLLGSLPVGVAGVDENGMLAYCNDIAAKNLKTVCSDIFGSDLFASCTTELGCLTERIRREKCVSADIALGSSRFHVLGRTMLFCESESVILVFLEMDAALPPPASF